MRSTDLLRKVAPALVVLSLAAVEAGCGPEEGLSQSQTSPESDVELVKDHLGITHVYAKSDADAFFGEGYSMARDRLFEMELNRRQARGTQAEVLGEGAVRGDIASRTMGFARLGAEDATAMKQQHPDDLVLVEAWVAGVNRRIEEIEKGAAKRPYGLRETELNLVPEKWTVEDAFAIGKTLAFGLSGTLDFDVLATAILRVAPGTVADLPVAMPAFDTFIVKDDSAPPAPAPAPAGPSIDALESAKIPDDKFSFQSFYPRLGSNNWAVDAAHSENGKPLLAGDPHQGLTSPSRLWPIHMSSVEAGGSIDVIGFSFVGTPGVQLGHNAHIGWTATTSFADVMDIWDVNAGGTFESVQLGGEAHAIATRSEKIAVKGGAAVSIDIHEVAGYGVILPDEILPVPRAFLADGQILFNWTGFAPTSEASAYMAIDRATNVDELEAAVGLIEVGAVNVVAIDSKEVTYRAHASVPDRGDPSSRPMPWHIVAADDPASFWTHGFLPDSLLPHSRNPKSGFIATANNDPFGFTADGSVENDAFYYGATYATGFRAFRIRQLIEEKLAKGKMTMADMEAIQRDTRQPMVDTIVPRLTAAIAAIGTDPGLAEYEGRADLVELANRLKAWDGQYRQDSGEAVIFFALQWFAARRVFEGPFTSPLFDGIASASQPYFIGQLRNVLEGRFATADKFLPNGPSALLLAALDDAASWLKDRFGSSAAPYAWGDVHVAELSTSFGGELSVPAIKRSGAIDTINVSDCSFFTDEGGARDEFVAHDGSVYRFVMGFGEDGRPTATIDFSHGTSGEPGDKHFSDQNDLWAQAGHTPLPFEKTDVDAHAESRVMLSAQ
jgi:penicillin amidase